MTLLPRRCDLRWMSLTGRSVSLEAGRQRGPQFDEGGVPLGFGPIGVASDLSRPTFRFAQRRRETTDLILEGNRAWCRLGEMVILGRIRRTRPDSTS